MLAVPITYLHPYACNAPLKYLKARNAIEQNVSHFMNSFPDPAGDMPMTIYTNFLYTIPPSSQNVPPSEDPRLVQVWNETCNYLMSMLNRGKMWTNLDLRNAYRQASTYHIDDDRFFMFKEVALEEAKETFAELFLQNGRIEDLWEEEDGPQELL